MTSPAVGVVADSQGSSPGEGPPDTVAAEIGPQLEDANGTVRVIVRLQDGNTEQSVGSLAAKKQQRFQTQAPAKQALVNKPGVEVKQQFWLINGMLVVVDTDKTPIAAVANVDGVSEVHADFEVQAMSAATASGSTAGVSESTTGISPQSTTQSSTESYNVTYGIDQINADTVWSQYDTKGAGTKVAVLDTGVEVDHPDIELYTNDSTDPTYPGGWAEFDDNGNQITGSEPYDDGDHGTHVSGTVAGGNASGTYIGVAPETQLMHGKVLDSGSGTYSQIIAGMEWAVENDADVISMSLGVSGYVDNFVDPVRNAEDHGVVVVASIGNSGEGESSTPGNGYDSLSVGATDSNEDVASFSSGETINTSEDWSNPPADWPDEYVVPNVAAPGVNVYSAYAYGGHVTKDGTSMAAPHAAGAVALIQSATAEHHSPIEIKTALRETARKPADWNQPDGEPDTRYGYGIIDVPAAIDYLSAGGAAFAVTDASLNRTTITEGDAVEVTATVENTGNESGTFTAELTENGTVVASQDVTVAAGATESVTFVRTYQTAGDYDLAVSGTTAGVVTVEQPATFDVTTAELNQTTITEGESVEISATIENTGDQDGTFTAELTINGTVVDSKDVAVAAGTTETVTFVRTFDQAGDYAIAVSGTSAGTLSVEQPATFTVPDASLNQTTITEGESVEVTGTIENTGDESGTFTAALTENGTVVASQDVTIAGGTTETITFVRTYQTAGDYDLAINGTSAGTLSVEAPAAFDVTDASLNRTTITEGDSVEISAAIANTGGRSGTFTAELTENGTVVASQDVTVAAGATESVTFVRTYQTAGDYDLAVSGTTAGVVTVEQPATFTVTDTALNQTTITEGESVQVTATVENTGDRDGTFTAELEIDGVAVDSQGVTVAAGTTETVTFVRTFDQAGDYAIAVSDTSAGTLSVEQPATFTVPDASLNQTTITEGESVEVTGTIENTGDQSGTFTAALTENGTVVASQDVTVSGRATETVSFVRTYQTAGAYELAINGTSAGTLTVEVPAALDVTGASLNRTTITEGESVEISATIENTGDQDGTFTAALTENGTVILTQEVTVTAGGTETVSFSRSYQTAGTYELAINGTSAGTLSVEAPAALDVTGASLNRSTTTEGESVEISATIENTGDQNGTFTADLTTNGTVVDSKDVTVAAGMTEAVTFVRTFDQAGDYAIAVSGTSAGTLTVEDDSSGGNGSGGGVGGGAGEGGGAGGGGGGAGGGGFSGGAGGGGTQNTTANDTVENDTQAGPPTADVTASDDGVVVSVPESTNGTAMSADLNGTISNDAFSITQLEFDVVPAADQFRLEMQKPSPESGPAPPLEGATSLGYVEINHDDPGDGTFEAVDFRFTVTRTQLPEDRSYDAVRLYRYSDGSWQELETRHDGDGRFVATSPGFSVFAVGIEQTAASGQVPSRARLATPQDAQFTSGDNTESPATRSSEATTVTPDESSGLLADARNSGLQPVLLVLSLVVLGGGITYRFRKSSHVEAVFANRSPDTTRGSESVQPDDADGDSEAGDSDDQRAS